MNGAEWLIHTLVDGGVEVVFGYPGGAIMPIYDALLGSKLRHILTRHEQGAALAADGYARATGKVGVCMATSGPGATNLVTGIANAYLDSIPLVAITGQVATPFLGSDAFQEVDILGITLPVVKHSFLIRDARDVPAVVAQALALAQSGRPGPVLIDVPKDVAQAVVEAADLRPARRLPRRFLPGVVANPGKASSAASRASSGAALATTSVEPSRSSRALEGATTQAAPAPSPAALAAAVELLARAQRPLVYVGGGVQAARAVHVFRRFMEVTGLPAVTTLKGLGTLPTDHPELLGMLGMHGSRAANLAVDACDLLVVVGARFDDRATGALAHFAPRAKVIHCDIDAAEVGKRRRADAALVADLSTALTALTQPLSIDPWRFLCRAMKEEHHTPPECPEDRIAVPWFLERLNSAAPKDTILTTDVGQHQMWAAQYSHIPAPEQFLTSGGLGTMGFGLPAALGAQLGKPTSTVITITGDGSVMMNIQELATLRRYALPVKIIVFDNRTLGMVRQWQELFFNERFSETDLSDNPDFGGIALACGVAAGSVRKPEEVDGAIAQMLAHEGPYLLHVHLDPTDKVWPLVPPGAGNTTMLEGKK